MKDTTFEIHLFHKDDGFVGVHDPGPFYSLDVVNKRIQNQTKHMAYFVGEREKDDYFFKAAQLTVTYP